MSVHDITIQSETFNFMLKKLNNWTECPVDVMVLTLFRLAQFHIIEVRRGRCGLGNYVLRAGEEQLDIGTLASQNVMDPQQIVDSIRLGQSSSATATDHEEPAPPADSESVPSPQPSPQLSSSASADSAVQSQDVAAATGSVAHLTSMEWASHVLQHTWQLAFSRTTHVIR